MYEKLKVGTVIEFKEDGKQFIFVGYESPFILIFYLYSPDMLESFDLQKQVRFLLGFEKRFHIMFQKQLNGDIVKAWYLRSRLIHRSLPMLQDNLWSSIKDVKNFSEINVFDMFYLNEDVYVYLDEAFGEYTCYYTGRIGMVTKEALLLESSSSCNFTANRLCILTDEQIRDNKEYLYFIKHLTKEQIKGMKELRYEDLLF